jgi:hypothetical protein
MAATTVILVIGRLPLKQGGPHKSVAPIHKTVNRSQVPLRQVAAPVTDEEASPFMADFVAEVG